MLPHTRYCSYYSLLGVKQDASATDIKIAYIEKCQQFHPDKNRGDLEKESNSKFVEIQHAYSVLSKQDSREHYDIVLSGRPKSNNGRYMHVNTHDHHHWDKSELDEFRKTVVYRIVRNISVFLVLLWMTMRSLYEVQLYRLRERCRLRDAAHVAPTNRRYTKQMFEKPAVLKDRSLDGRKLSEEN